MKVDGRCHCGQIRYEAEIDADQVNICHCTDCQTLTGTAYRVSVPTPAASFVLLAGMPKIYIKTADSGNRRAQAFCANCGSMRPMHRIRRPLDCESARSLNEPRCPRNARSGFIRRCRGPRTSAACRAAGEDDQLQVEKCAWPCTDWAIIHR